MPLGFERPGSGSEAIGCSVLPCCSAVSSDDDLIEMPGDEDADKRDVEASKRNVVVQSGLVDRVIAW